MDFEITEMEGLSGEMAKVYSVTMEGDEQTLIEQFFNENTAHMDDLILVRDRIQTMANYTGCRKAFFKEGEGALADGVVALKGTGHLRLYGIYFNHTVVLFGSGGYKPANIRAYEEEPQLNAKAQQMREIAKEINKRINNRELRIEDDGQITEL